MAMLDGDRNARDELAAQLYAEARGMTIGWGDVKGVERAAYSALARSCLKAIREEGAVFDVKDSPALAMASLLLKPDTYTGFQHRASIESIAS